MSRGKSCSLYPIAFTDGSRLRRGGKCRDFGETHTIQRVIIA